MESNRSAHEVSKRKRTIVRGITLVVFSFAWVGLVLADGAAVAPTGTPATPATRPYYLSVLDGSGKRAWVPESKVPVTGNPNVMVMYEVTQYPDRAPNAEEQQRADDLLKRSLASARRHGWFDITRGIQDGFKLMYADAEHYVNEEFVFDDHVLDPERPEFLMYYETNRGPKLAGFMFLTRRPEERGPQIGGPLTIWHYHIWHRLVCLQRGMFPVANPQADGSCSEGAPTQRSPEMLHVWFVDHPGGPFSTAMKLPSKVIQTLANQPQVGADGSTVATTDTGAAWTPAVGARFKTRWDGTAYDRKTGLIWEVKEKGDNCSRCVSDRFAWTTRTNNPDGSAFSVYLDRLNNTCNGDGAIRCTQMIECTKVGLGLCGLGGFHDWRLPTMVELRGLLFQKQGCTLNPCVDSSLPGPTQSDAYWSGSADPREVTKAGAVNFATGAIGAKAKTESAYVRAVCGFTSEGSVAAAPPAAAHEHHHEH